MKIRITEQVIKLNVNGKLATYVEGDEVTVSDDIGKLCVSHGWADDVDGQVETGARVPGANGPVEPENVKQNPSA